MHRILSGALSIEKLTVAIANLPVSLQGTKIVQLSDLHYDGLRLSEKMLEQAISVANEAEADLLAIMSPTTPRLFINWYCGLKACKAALVFTLYWETTISITATLKPKLLRR